jgi:tetratricopeptide (TPR) repeat protein
MEPAFAQASMPDRVAHGEPAPADVPCVTNAIGITVRDMPGPAAPPPSSAPAPSGSDLKAELARLTAEYSATASIAALRGRLDALIANATPDALMAAAEPHRDEPEIIAPIYEAVVEAQPDNARALVILANAYWLQGRGPQVVGELATKAIAADPANRGAWHLWALSESDPRSRVRRWQQVSERFPGDDLALAAVADNAASVAGAEHDYGMLDVAIETYERLLQRTTEPSQREAVSTALIALRGWTF